MRVCRGPKDGIDAEPRKGELSHGGLAEQDGACARQPFQGERIFRRNVVGQKV